MTISRGSVADATVLVVGGLLFWGSVLLRRWAKIGDDHLADLGPEDDNGRSLAAG